MTILALVMTVLMGGILAYNGDVIGRRYGKRRVTLFGLRPRHSAIIVTTITGVAISAFTTGILFLVVPPVRAVILEGEEAIRAKAQLERDKASLLVTIEANRKSLTQVRAELIKTQIAMQDKQRQRDRLDSQLASAEGQLRTERAAVAQARSQVASARAESARLAASNKELAATKQQLEAQGAQLAQRNGELKRQNEDLTASNKVLTGQNAAMQEENGKLGNENVKLVRENNTLIRARDTLQRSNDDLRGQGNQLAADNQRLTGENTKLAEQNSLLKDRLQHVQQLAPDFDNLLDAYLAVRARRVAVHKDEDLARCVIKPNSSPDEVREALNQLTGDAGLAASAKGAGPGEGGRAVRIATKQFYTSAQWSSGQLVVPVPVTAEDRLQGMVDRLSRQPSPYCVLALAVANSVELEPAAIDFQPFPDPLIYTKGGIVGARRFDASDPPEKLFSQVVDFLKGLGQEALRRGAVPHMDPITGEPQVGSMGAGDLVKLVERVRAAGRIVRVTALAADDVSASSPLVMDFRLDPSL